MREKLSKYFMGDAVIWGIIILLSLVSLLAVYSSTGTLAYKYEEGNTFHYLMKHAGLLFFGILIIYITHLIPYRFYIPLSALFFYVAIPLLLWTLIKGTSLNEASRWLTLPGTGISFQTSDFAKFALILYIARFLSQKQESIKDFKEFRTIMGAILLICGLILPANFSTAAILFATSFILLFVGRVNIKYLLAMAGAGIIALSIFILIMVNLPENKQGRIGTWKNRVENFMSGNSEENFQSDQAKIAIVTGGLFGKGPGNSTQRNFLPHPYSDFIFAIIVEEWGLAGGFVLILFYLFLLYRAGMIVRNCSSQFAAFVALGLTFSLVFQAFINMAVAVNLIPVTGQTLPFVSMGGTSILFTSAALGIILSVSRVKNNKSSEETNEPEPATA